MTSTSGEAGRLVQPTVLGAMRRHWLLVCVVVFACVDLALAYGAFKPEEYRATATVSAPRPAASALQSDAQYLDSQVLLLNSREVGDRAHEIARATPAGAGIARGELAPTIGQVEIVPPTSGSTGGYGTTIVSIHFTSRSAEEAQAGVNALATAYDEIRSQEIADQTAARIEGIDRAIATSASPSDVTALREERVQAVVDQGRDLALEASIASAERPESPAGSGLPALLAAGLVLGLVAGGAAAYLRASRLGHVGSAHVPRVLYDAPLLYELRRATGLRDGQLTESDRLLGRAVAHRLASFETPVLVAVVAIPGHRARSTTAAALALALAEDDARVLAVDGDDGTLARTLHPSSKAGRPGRGQEPARVPVPSRLQKGLLVLDTSGLRTHDWESVLDEVEDRIVVVDCPPASSSASAVDLLSRCDAAVVLVRADEPVREHAELARWLDLAGPTVLGYVFSPYSERWGRDRSDAPGTSTPAAGYAAPGPPVRQSSPALQPTGAQGSPPVSQSTQAPRPRPPE